MTSPCICNDRLSFLHSRTLLLYPSFHFPLHFPRLEDSNSGHGRLLFGPVRRRTSVRVFAVDREALPQSAIHRIVEKLRSLGYVEESTIHEKSSPDTPSPGEIFVPLRANLPKHRVGHTLDPSWSTPENPIPEPGSGNAIQRFHGIRREVLKEKEEERLRKIGDGKRERAPTLGELTLHEDELRRLRTAGIGLKKKLKIGRVGITEGIVNGIHERWRRSELVKITCDDICRLNMKRTHDLLERKTGGLVIWRSGSNIILYRGADYKYPYFFTDNDSSVSFDQVSPDVNMDQGVLVEEGTGAVESSTLVTHPPLVHGVGLPNRVRLQLPGELELVAEADNLLEGLGPRFTEWWGYDPLPVDADLLPAVVPGYRKPFRLLPYGVKPKLTNDEMTALRRLGLPLPCHFALGRNRKLQGLAVSILKLWEKSEIAKIAVKRGVQNTNSELMAEELKRLTGGTLLSRDREFISLYRGKDFLPAAVSSAIDVRRLCRMPVIETKVDKKLMLNEKEHAHWTKDYIPEFEQDGEEVQKFQFHSEVRMRKRSETVIERTSTKLSLALSKKSRAEKLLEELKNEEIPQPPETDKEGITEEERYMLRKVGLRMHAFLLLGRRGVFDGTIENMHLHWKYRELVKVLISRRSIEEVHKVARILEAESGGILVAIERVNRGYVIIVYRGKNYQRPTSLRPQTLLSKREAMKRSLEAQRRQSLKLHVLELTKNIDELKLKLVKEQELVDFHENNDTLFDNDLEKDYQLYTASEENGEIHGADATSLNPEDGSLGIIGQQARSDSTSLRSYYEGNDMHGMQMEKFQPLSVIKEAHVSLDINEKKENIYNSAPKEELKPISVPNKAEVSFFAMNEEIENADSSLCQEPSDQVKASDATCIRAFIDDKFPNAQSETSASDAREKCSEIHRPASLSNRQRLILRKHALRMKNQPVLAVGKRNIITGVAKTIRAHFEKHPLAIVNIKGRAKGTSIREVVHILEQATGSVLVSQEPSKVILYRHGGTAGESIKDLEMANQNLKGYGGNDDKKTRQFVSSELISAIKLECGLKSAKELSEPYNKQLRFRSGS